MAQYFNNPVVISIYVPPLWLLQFSYRPAIPVIEYGSIRNDLIRNLNEQVMTGMLVRPANFPFVMS